MREKAEERVFARASELGHAQGAARTWSSAIVGCMAEHLKERSAERAPDVDVIAGPDSYRRMPDLRRASARGRPRRRRTRVDATETYEGLVRRAGGDGVSGFVTIQRGCDKFCTFCVVPFTRGRERGAAPREILRQVRALVAAGYREVSCSARP